MGHFQKLCSKLPEGIYDVHCLIGCIPIDSQVSHFAFAELTYTSLTIQLCCFRTINWITLTKLQNMPISVCLEIEVLVVLQ